MPTDYGLAVEYLMTDAEYGTATTYADLERTWTDARTIPTQVACDTAWISVYKQIKIASVLEIREQRKYPSDIDYLTYTFNTGEPSCTLISTEINRCVRKSLTLLENAWWDTSNVDRLTTLAELEGLEDVITTRVITVMIDAKTAKVDIEAATTIGEIDTIYDAYVAG